MTAEHTLGKQTLFNNIYELEPACYLKFKFSARELKILPYWQLRLETRKNLDIEIERTKIRRLLEKSLKGRLLSDVPVGTYLSGGVDSSAITALTSKYLPYTTHSFSLIFDHPQTKSEETYMQIFLKKYPQVKQHFVKLTAQTYWQNFVRATWYNDYPLVFAADVAQYLLSKKAKTKMTVVLSGQGSDEIFAGYGRHKLAAASGFYHHFASLLLYKIIQFFSLVTHQSAGVNLNRFFSPELAQAMMINFFHDYRKKFLYAKKLAIYNKPLRKNISYQSNGQADYLARFLYKEINSYLKTILHHQDRMNMANGVEGRMTFLDHQLVQEVLALPWQYKVSTNNEKIILKEAVADLLPLEILQRPKVGFDIPFIYLLEKISWGKNIFANSRLVADGLFRKTAINYYYLSKNDKAVYTLLATEIWYRLFIKKEKIIQVQQDLMENFKKP